MSDTRTDLYETPRSEIPGTAWTLLQKGCDSARDPFHTPVLATMGDFGPSQRMVVLRQVDPAQRILACHTDSRTLKLREVRENAPSSWLFYDRERKLQLRLGGLSSVHTDDRIADLRWAETTERGKACYNSPHPPGKRVTQPLLAPDLLAGASEATAARARFAVLATQIDFLDWLLLSINGHRRAQFLWKDGEWRGGWVAP